MSNHDLPELQLQGVTRPYRVLLRVRAIEGKEGAKVVEVVVPSWDPEQVVRIPVTLLPEDIASRVIADMRLFAEVNIGAQRAEELHFSNFEIAPVPQDDDGLA